MKNDIELANLILNLYNVKLKYEKIEGTGDSKFNTKIYSAIIGINSLFVDFNKYKTLNQAQRNFAHKLISNAKHFN